MKISFNSIFSYEFPLFKENLVNSLTDRQKKIVIIAFAAFACLALYVLRRYYFKPNAQPSTPSPQPVQPLTGNDIESLREKAKTSIEERNANRRIMILAYINNVLDNPNFQKNPRAFMKDWKEKRDDKDILRIDDMGMMFFESMVKDGIIK